MVPGLRVSKDNCRVVNYRLLLSFISLLECVSVNAGVFTLMCACLRAYVFSPLCTCGYAHTCMSGCLWMCSHLCVHVCSCVSTDVLMCLWAGSH